MAVSQKNRKIQVFTSLAEDTLLFYQLHGDESLNQPFEYQLELISEHPDIDPAQLLGEPICVALEKADGEWRYFNGCVTRFGQYEDLHAFAHYRATVRPWLWLLTRASNCRIFQNQSVPDIIRQVFHDHGFGDFKEALSASYPVREYCVQYRETDFNFVSRLLEEEGIGYYFAHEKDKHILILIDSNNAYDPFPGYENIPYHADTAATDRSRQDHIHHWAIAQEVQPGAYEITDYDFKKPNADLRVKSTIKASHAAHAEYECFDYPGCYTETSQGDNFVRLRIEEHHARYERCEGKCNARGLAVGYRFNLQEYPRKDQNREYLVVSATYHLLLDAYFSHAAAGDAEKVFDCSFTAQDNQRAYRPARVAAKPFVRGAQTAMVVGPAGEEIHTDPFGRVKVQFHWDRYGNRNQDSSCWVRVSQPWAGKSWGMIAIPRIGQEVIVDFLEGDPDQPIITGSVYNADTLPPYPLPGAGMVSGIKSNTHKGKGYNELSMDDTAGQEKVTIHGQYDMNTTVEHDQTNTVMNHRNTTIQNGNDTLTVAAGIRTVAVKGDSTHIVQTGSRIVTVEAADYVATAAKTVFLHGKGKGVGITGDVEGIGINGNGKGVKIDGKGEGVSIWGEPNVYCEGQSGATVTSPKIFIGSAPGINTLEINLTAENVAIGEKDIVIKGNKIELRTEGGSITIDSSGITIEGTIAHIN